MAGGCAGFCYEMDEENAVVEERLSYVGAGNGSYHQVSNMEKVGKGKGDFEKEKVVVSTGYKLNMAVCGGTTLCILVSIFLLLGFANNWWQSRGMSDVVEPQCSMMIATTATVDQKTMCCNQGYKDFCQREVHNVDQYWYHVKDVRVPHMVSVPIPPPPRKVITHKVYVHSDAFDCNQGAYDMHSWSEEQSRYCCYKHEIGCKTKMEYRPHYHTITKVKPVPVHVPVPIPAPPAQVITHVQNIPIHDPPAVIKVPTPGAPHVVNKYVHEKNYVPVPVASPPQYHHVPVPVPVQDPGRVIKVPEPLPPQTIVKNKAWVFDFLCDIGSR